MVERKVSSAFFGLIALAALAACGMYTPDKDPFVGDPLLAPDYRHTWQGNYEKALINHVTCEISRGLFEARWRLKTYILKGNWLNEKWGTAVTLTLTVEDQTGLSPGVSTITPLPNRVFSFPTGGNFISPQSFSLNLGGTASVNALRTETIQWTVRNSDLVNYHECRYPPGVLIDGDLKIKDFVYDKVQLIEAASGLWDPLGKPPYNTWTEEITFVSAYGATATPTWHLARVSANASSNLVVGQRTNTNDLVITLGPLDPCQQTPSDHAAPQRRPVRRDFAVQQPPREPPPGLFEPDSPPAPNAAPPERAAPRHRPARRPLAMPAPHGQKTGCPFGVEEAPLQLSAAAMNQHNARVQANAIAVSITGQSH
jgi:hypothetical protein